MIAYSDNEHAKMLHGYAKNTKFNRETLARILEKSIGVPNNTLELENISEYYLNEGTHYFEPLRGIYKSRDYFLKIAQHPSEKMWVVGEMVSKNQGWVEGALESVEKVIGEVLKSL
jgi:monoamine oxidase